MTEKIQKLAEKIQNTQGIVRELVGQVKKEFGQLTIEDFLSKIRPAQFDSDKRKRPTYKYITPSITYKINKNRSTQKARLNVQLRGAPLSNIHRNFTGQK